ncbi:hypothetical protein GCM10023215_34340 [Pseudonocardia yuanmonensis]|uniref:Uncharacterized protein n=1 Tax=Pseudonocardia yuanmonensis TaxID=1095914 RepID=A0ABP8WU78_9PSEU
MNIVARRHPPFTRPAQTRRMARDRMLGALLTMALLIATAMTGLWFLLPA